MDYRTKHTVKAWMLNSGVMQVSVTTPQGLCWSTVYAETEFGFPMRPEIISSFRKSKRHWKKDSTGGACPANAVSEVSL